MKYNILITILLTSLTTFAQTLSLDTGETYAVVVGISDYQDPQIPDLRFADKDALAFAGFLQSPAGGELDEDYLKVLVNEQATVAQFAIALDWLWEVVKENDKVIIYFSGHGDVERKSITQPGYLLCWDAPSRVYMAGGAFGVNVLNDVVSTLSIQNKAKVILVTDACRAGKLSGSGIGGSQATAANLAKQYANEIKILSCQPDEYSIEGEQWGDGRGAFSYHLLDGLYGMADGNGDLNVNLKEIGRYLEDNVTEQVAPEKQNPMILGDKAEKLTDVFPEIVNQLKEGRRGQMQMFKPTETRGIETDVLASVDSTTQEIYAAFKRALKEKQFLEPVDACADVYYEILIKEPKMERLHSSMRRNYAAALQDDAQQVMNTMLKSGLTELLLKGTSAAKLYKNYPNYLDRAAALLGEDHYMYPILQARKYYFEGRIAKKSQDKRAFYHKALSIEPDMAHAMVALIQNVTAEHPDSAEIYFQRATTLSPNWVEPYISLSKFYEAEIKDLKEAEDLLNQAGQLDSTSLLVWYIKACFYERQKKYKAAERWYLKAVEASEGDICFPCAYNNLGNVYEITHRYAEAEKYFKKAIQLDSTNVYAYNNLGTVYGNTHRYAEAEKYFKKALQLDSTYVDAYHGLGVFYTNTRRRYVEAEKYFKKAIQLDSTLVYAYYSLGNVYQITRRYVEAEKYLNKTIQLDSTYIDAYNELGIVYRNTRSYVEAEKCFKKAIQLDSTFVYAYNNLGNVYQITRRYVEAEKYLKKALQLDSTYILAYNNLGLVYHNTHRYAEAEKYFKKAIQLDSTYIGAYNNLGVFYKKNRRYVEAEKYYKKTLQLDSTIWVAYANLGLQDQFFQRWEASEDMILKSIKYSPPLGLLHAILGNAYTHLPGKMEEAKKELDKALEMDVNHPDTYIYLAQWSLKNNQIEEAWQYLEQGLEKGLENGELELDYLKTQPDFEEMRKDPKWNELLQKYFPDQHKK